MQQTEEKFKMVAKTFFGLEEVLAQELREIGGEDIEILTRAVSFSGTKEIMYRANLELRTALRILKPITKFRVKNEKDLYRGAKKYEWSQHLTTKTTFALTSNIYSEYFNHENYVSLKVKDAIVDNLREVYGARPNVDTKNPDIQFHVHIFDDECTISLDSSGNSLHKRGYRIGQAIAPINEVLAAGMILLSGWNGDSDFIDPMCGSGTILMEAATIAYNIAPGSRIEEFGFMKWNDWDATLWRTLVKRAERRRRDFEHKILGFDESRKAIDIAKDNIKNADLGWKILLKTKPMEELTKEELTDGGVVMINPPYGERMNEDDVYELYKTIGDSLKQNFDGYDVWIISPNKDALKKIGLRTSRKLTLYNGPLECKFQKYEIYQGTRKSKYLNNNESENKANP
jgi:putative N6-adenine-specific DNA methylase